MLKSLNKFSHGLFFAIAFFSITACQTTSGEYTGKSNMPILVIGEDEDPATAPRSSNIFKRVIGELKSGMARQGFRVVDEESVAVDLGWRIQDRRSKYELIEAVKLMNSSSKSSHRIRAYTLFRIYNQVQQLDFATKITTRIEGEIYDAVTNQFLAAYELSPRIASGPANCTSQRCIDEIAGTGARELAANLSDVLGGKLSYMADNKIKSGDFSDGKKKATQPHGSRVTYNLTLKGFKTFESLEIIAVMVDEFPGYTAHDLVSMDKKIRRYEYKTMANAAKLDKWMNILLRDMGFNPDENVLISLHDNTIFVEYLKPGQSPSKTTPNIGNIGSGRFN